MTAGTEPLDSPAEAGDKRRTLSLAQKFAIAFLGLVTAVPMYGLGPVRTKKR